MAKGGGGNNNKEALKLQRQSMLDSRKQAERMEKLMKQSAEAAGGLVLPEPQPTPAAPTQTSADLDAAAMDMRQRMLRKQGLNSTVYAGSKPAKAA